MSAKEQLTPYEKWSREIVAAEKNLVKFHERGRRTVRKFIDERSATQQNAKWFNVFYANTNILESALYAQLPKPSVTRRFKDYKDDTARVAGLILQRSITQDLDDPRDTFDATMKQCVQDRLVSGLAMAWLRLETDTEAIEGVELESDDLIPSPQPDMETEEIPSVEPMRITDQRVVVDYIFWEDFIWSPCRVWDERRWIGRKVYMSREELVKRFGEKKANEVPLSTKERKDTFPEGSEPKEMALEKGMVYEIWDRTERKVIWFVKGLQELLDERNDPLGLVGFEPCPRPMLANISTSNSVPRPDYYMIQDQYSELDLINNRISKIVQACKVVGVYDKAAKGVQRMLQEGAENTMIPVDDWAMFAEKGGIKGQIDWLPLETITTTLNQLNQARDVIKAQIYELTGISDIVRGASKASETLGAQEIKAQFAGVRIKKLQDEVSKFAGDVLRIKAEIQVKHFTPEMLLVKSNIMATGNDEWVEPAMQLLASEEGFEWRIQVTAESIAQADYAFEKADRNEFLQAVSTFMEKMLPMVQANPDSQVLMTSMLKWGIAGYRNSAEIEGMLDKELDEMVRKSKEPKPPPGPTPEQQKAQAEMQKLQAETQADQAKAQQELQIKQQEAMMEQQRAAMEFQAEQQRLAMEMMFERQNMELDKQRKEMELQFAQLMQMLKLRGAQEMQDAKLEGQESQMELKLEAQNGTE
jgi:hypothetical protein